MDLDGSGTLSKEEFLEIKELRPNPIVERVLDLFDQDGNNEIDLKEFIEGISQFSAKGNKESKLRCNTFDALSTHSLFFLIFLLFKLRLEYTTWTKMVTFQMENYLQC